jgi:hypothetical protein
MIRKLGVLAAIVAVVLAGVFGFMILKRSTQYEGGEGEGTQTAIVFDADTRGAPLDDRAAASALWTFCATQLRLLPVPELAEREDGNFGVLVRPSLAEDSERRLVGCLNDGTLDTVRGEVIDATTS